MGIEQFDIAGHSFGGYMAVGLRPQALTLTLTLSPTLSLTLTLTLALTLTRWPTPSSTTPNPKQVAYALKHPTRVSSLVLVSPAGLSGPPHGTRQADYSWRHLPPSSLTFHPNPNPNHSPLNLHPHPNPHLRPNPNPNPNPDPNPHSHPYPDRFRRFIGLASTMLCMGVTPHPNPNPNPNPVTPHL